MTDQGITPSDTQNLALQKIKHWFQNETGRKQVMYIAGFAGSGKTTIVKFAIQELDLKIGDLRVIRKNPGATADVFFAAFTGKAALVMRKAGVPASTIHSLVYAVSETSKDEIDEATKLCDQMELDAAQLSLGLGRLDIAVKVKAERQRIKKMKEPSFGLNQLSPIADAKLLVLDECSMIGLEMAADVLSFGKPILVLGDPGQLPPIKGEGAFTSGEPDIFLTEIHRQAAESPIIRLATMARQGIQIPYGWHDAVGDVVKMSRRLADPALLLAGDGSQVICGLNRTRLMLNQAMRQEAGFADGDPMPTSENEKIICLKNRHDLGLINGMFLTLQDIRPIDDLRFEAEIIKENGYHVGKIDDEGNYERFPLYAGHFLDHVAYDKHRAERDWHDKKGLIEATFGWAITCHKAQGSSFDPVIVWDDHMSRSEDDRRRWLYTAITRAVSRLLILD